MNVPAFPIPCVCVIMFLLMWMRWNYHFVLTEILSLLKTWQYKANTTFLIPSRWPEFFFSFFKKLLHMRSNEDPSETDLVSGQWNKINQKRLKETYQCMFAVRASVWKGCNQVTEHMFCIQISQVQSSSSLNKCGKDPCLKLLKTVVQHSPPPPRSQFAPLPFVFLWSGKDLLFQAGF